MKFYSNFITVFTAENSWLQQFLAAFLLFISSKYAARDLPTTHNDDIEWEKHIFCEKSIFSHLIFKQRNLSFTIQCCINNIVSSMNRLTLLYQSYMDIKPTYCTCTCSYCTHVLTILYLNMVTYCSKATWILNLVKCLSTHLPEYARMIRLNIYQFTNLGVVF